MDGWENPQEMLWKYRLNLYLGLLAFVSSLFTAQEKIYQQVEFASLCV